MNTSFLKDKRFRLVMISSLLWGLVAHGPAMFGKFSFHDDVPWFNGVGVTYELGRWGLGLSGEALEQILGSMHYSTPALKGILTIAAVAAMAYIICLVMKIENRVLIIGLCGVMVCFPAITNIFGFVYTAPYYYIGALLGVIGAYLFFKKRSLASFLVCAVFMTVSTALYQSNIPINLMILLLFMLEEVYSSDMKWKEYVILAAKNALLCAVYMGVYFLANSVILKVKGRVMYDYKGVNNFGFAGIGEYIYRVYTAYKRFVKPADYINYDGVSANMFPWNIKYFHILLIFITVILLAFLLMNLKNRRKMVQIGILCAVSPLFAYFFYVMVGEPDSHGGMAFGEVLMFALCAFIIERIMDLNKWTVTLSRIGMALILVISVLFVRYANVCYLKIYVMQSEAISYYNTLITRIESAEGYTKDTPVAFAGEWSKNDDDFSGNKLFDPIYLPPYQGNSIINDFSWKETMKLWCGFDWTPADESDIPALNDSISKMPCYPDDGSVRMVDNVLVVKFSD